MKNINLLINALMDIMEFENEEFKRNGYYRKQINNHLNENLGRMYETNI